MQNNKTIKNAVRDVIKKSLINNGVIILPPMDVKDTLRLLAILDFHSECFILDPWYNKGVGGIRDDYDEFIVDIFNLTGPLTDHIYFWGFPEIVARFINNLPEGFILDTWLTWFYKNCPSKIRGWRSAQNTCLHIRRPEARIYPEHFLNEVQKEKQRQGKLFYMPGPPNVIEAPLNIGFVGKDEQTGHPSQKPEKVYEQLVLMATEEGDLIIDPMAGSGTTGSVTKKLKRYAILCDISEEYTQIMENRLKVGRLVIPQLPALFKEENCGQALDVANI